MEYKTLLDIQQGMEAGRIKCGHTAWVRGYVSRRPCRAENVPCYYSRKMKAYYVLFPSWESTQYCRRTWYYAV